MSGRLLVCATPIGNLEDVTLRVLAALGDADVILAEDTRITRRLLARYDIHTPLERYDEHVAAQRTPELAERCRSGVTLALVSDAGTPGVSDPGARLVDAFIEAGLPVEVLPGPSAILASLVASGLPTHAFYFGGFPPRKAGELAAVLGRLSSLDATLIFYESPRRAAKTLRALADAFPGRDGALARELTKIHEEVLRGSLEDLAGMIAERPDVKGEVVLLVGPPVGTGAVEIDAESISRQVEELRSQGLSARDAVDRASKETGVARKVVYEIAHAPRTARDSRSS